MRFLLVLLALVLASCGDTSTSPKNENPEGQDTSGFAITKLYHDSLYLGEQTSIQVNESGDDIGELQLFIHTVPVVPDRLEEGRIYFTLPEGASTGKIRLYKGKLLATGDFTITIFPVFRANLKPTVANVSPYTVAVGDLIYIGGYDFPLRKKDVAVKIGDVIQPIEFIDPMSILIRVKPGTTSGELTVKLFDEMFTGNEVIVFAQSGSLFESDALNEITIVGSSIDGVSRIIRGDVPQVVPIFSLYAYAGPVSQPDYFQRIGDSIVFTRQGSLDGDTSHVELRLKQTPGTHKVSGTVRVYGVHAFGSPSEATREIEFRIKDMSFSTVNGTTTIYSTATDITSQLLDLKYRQVNPGFQMSEEVVEYFGGVSSSSFSIVLRH